MLNTKAVSLAAIAAFILYAQAARAQGSPASGFYQIVSGEYITCCGIAGPFSYGLPNSSDAFVELTLDPQNYRAQMKFLGLDTHTVLTIPAEPCRSEFVYSFTNGMIFPDYIQFGDPLQPPVPGQPSFSFVVSNSMNTISINGTVYAPCPGSADLPETFQHTNVLAVLMPAATIRVSQVEICWNSASNRTYQVQYRSPLTTNAWINLGSPVVGNGSTNCVPDAVSRAQAQRFYRVLVLP